MLPMAEDYVMEKNKNDKDVRDTIQRIVEIKR